MGIEAFFQITNDDHLRTALLDCANCNKRSIITILVEQNRQRPPICCPYCGNLNKVCADEIQLLGDSDA